MDSTELTEKRFERALERLFSGSSAPAASSVGGPSPAKKKKTDQETTSGRAIQTAGDVEASPGPHGCRPWDRGDLFRRLATYKSTSWFGKPQVAGPVECARRGWENVDIDLLACETCGSRLSFPVPPSWSHHQVERAALTFAEQLDLAHKGLCAWKNNPCAETLAYFPPTPVADLRGAYTDRCEALLKLSALPVISETAKQQMRLSRAAQLDQLLSERSPKDPAFLHAHGVGGSGVSEDDFFAMSKGFYESQRMIALCGWEPRLLSYTVDNADHPGAQANEQTGTLQGSGPSVTVRLRGDQNAKVSQSESQPEASSSDPASVKLDCKLCGANVLLWNFATVNSPAPLVSSGLEEILSSKKKPLESDIKESGADELAACSGVEDSEAADALDTKPLEVVPVNTLGRAAPQKGVLDLKLTIAGGPRPTRLNAPLVVIPPLGNPALLHTEVQSKRTEAAASYESRRPEHQDRGTGNGASKLEDVPLPAGTIEGKMADVRETDNVEGAPFSRNGKRKRDVASQRPSRPMKQPAVNLAHASSVNAIDTRYLPKQENSMESVDNALPVCDAQCADTAKYDGNGPASVVQAEHSNGAAKSKSGVGVEEGVRTTEVGTTSRTGITARLRGLHREGVGGFSGAEIYSNHLERVESVAEYATEDTELMEEFVSGRCLMDDFVPETTDLIDNQRSSQQGLLGFSVSFFKDTLSVEVSERRQGKGDQKEAGEDANAGSTMYATITTNKGLDAEASLQNTEVAHEDMLQASPTQRNEEVQSRSFFPPGLPSEDVRKLDIDVRHFDPIRQHRHFCPWVHGHVVAAPSSTRPDSSCGWEILLDALQDPCSTASELAASKRKDDPLRSVKKFLGSVPTSQPPKL